MFSSIFDLIESNVFVFSSDDSSLSYSRLETSGVKPSQSAVSLATTKATTAGSVSRRIFRCLSTPKLVVSSRAKRNKHNNEEVEREWLLLGEPQSPRSTVIFDDVQDTSSLSLAIAAVDRSHNDAESACSPDATHKETSSVDSDSSTDIDAIVDEYRQKVKVTSAGTKEKILRLPSDESWKVSIVCVTVTCIAAMVAVIGIAAESIIALGTGTIGKDSYMTNPVLSLTNHRAKYDYYSCVAFFIGMVPPVP